MKRTNLIRVMAVFVLLLTIFQFTPVRAGAWEADEGLPLLQGEKRARLPELVTGKTVTLGTRTRLTVGGIPFGIRLFEEGVLIVGTAGEHCPASEAGLKRNDRILTVDGKTVRTVRELMNAIDGSEGRSLSLTYSREGQKAETTITPEVGTDQKYRVGIWVRDNTAGIGTLTYVNPTTGEFGGLGHGVCDPDGGELIPLKRGAVVKTEISGVVRGTEGTPGELKGFLRSEKMGALTKNCERGVFGVLTNLPEGLGETVEIATREEVKAGPACLRCTLSDGVAHEYAIELTDVKNDNRTTKSFCVHVTDPELLQKTGGIVQGMSGSPIIQNGRLVGAVTHVFIGDPTRGYGIFIENMLDSAG